VRRLTQSEAIEMIETTWDCAPDTIGSGLIEAFIPEISTVQARQDVDSFLAVIASEIEPASITIHRDEIEGSDMQCARIVVRTGEAE
jgi:hypothetical protein